MNVGTKSVLFGAHAFWFHPYVVWRAFVRLYGRQPIFWEAVCILVHDLGYWGKPNMDGSEGETHPEGGARIVHWLYTKFHHSSCEWAACHWYCWAKYHSRYYAHKHNAKPSDLCWADKASIWFEPEWFYLLRTRLSGELLEYRLNAHKCIPQVFPDRCWLHWYKNKVVVQVRDRIPATRGHHEDEDIPDGSNRKNTNCHSYDVVVTSGHVKRLTEDSSEPQLVVQADAVGAEKPKSAGAALEIPAASQPRRDNQGPSLGW